MPVLHLAQFTGAHLHAGVAYGQLHLGQRFFTLLPLVVAPEKVQGRLDALVTFGPTGWHIAQVDHLVVEITAAQIEGTSLPEETPRAETAESVPE